MKVSITIIGGGIIGHMTAVRALEANPELRVLVLDQDLPGNGATARSAGVHLPLGRTERVRSMTVESQRYYDAARTRSPDLPIAPLPMTVHCSLDREAWLRQIFIGSADLRRLGPDGEGARPAASPSGRWHVSGAHQANVRPYVDSIRRAFSGQLLAINGVKVVAIEEAVDHLILRIGDGRLVQAERVVLAPGPWALEPEFAPFTAPLGIRIKKVVAFELDDQREAERRLEFFAEDDAFLVPRPDTTGRLFSYTSSTWDVSPATLFGGVSAHDREEAEQVLLRNVAHLCGKLGGARVFCDAYSPDREPIIERIGDTGRMVFVGAANGSGYRLAPAIAAEALGKLGLARRPEV